MKVVTAAILIKDQNILIAQRKVGDKLANKWEFPGGTIEDGESPEQCLKREIKEEFDIDVSVGEYIGESVYHYNHGSIRLLAYKIYWVSGDIQLKAHKDYRWASIDQLTNYDLAPADVPIAKELIKNDRQNKRN
jgi:8-oxo-dGTP diphosphatase